LRATVGAVGIAAVLLLNLTLILETTGFQSIFIGTTTLLHSTIETSLLSTTVTVLRAVSISLSAITV